MSNIYFSWDFEIIVGTVVIFLLLSLLGCGQSVSEKTQQVKKNKSLIEQTSSGDTNRKDSKNSQEGSKSTEKEEGLKLLTAHIAIKGESVPFYESEKKNQVIKRLKNGQIVEKREISNGDKIWFHHKVSLDGATGWIEPKNRYVKKVALRMQGIKKTIKLNPEHYDTAVFQYFNGTPEGEFDRSDFAQVFSVYKDKSHRAYVFKESLHGPLFSETGPSPYRVQVFDTDLKKIGVFPGFSDFIVSPTNEFVVAYEDHGALHSPGSFHVFRRDGELHDEFKMKPFLGNFDLAFLKDDYLLLTVSIPAREHNFEYMRIRNIGSKQNSYADLVGGRWRVKNSQILRFDRSDTSWIPFNYRTKSVEEIIADLNNYRPEKISSKQTWLNKGLKVLNTTEFDSSTWLNFDDYLFRMDFQSYGQKMTDTKSYGSQSWRQQPGQAVLVFLREEVGLVSSDVNITDWTKFLSVVEKGKVYDYKDKEGHKFRIYLREYDNIPLVYKVQLLEN